MSKNNILFTRYSYTQKGEFADLQIVKRGLGQLPIKTSDKHLLGQSTKDVINKYGGYNKVAGAYFVLVEHYRDNEVVRTIEFVPVYLLSKIEKDPQYLIAYLENNLAIKCPKILLAKIKFDTLFELDGFRMHLSARSNERLSFKGANQLVVSAELEAYIKKLFKFVARYKIAEKNKKELLITNYDKISTRDNLVLYDEYIHKLSNTIYKVKLSTVAENLKKKRDNFIKLSLEKQAVVLCNILRLFQCNIESADLKLIDSANKTGKITIGKDIGLSPRLKIINQSITGLFEKVIELDSL